METPAASWSSYYGYSGVHQDVKSRSGQWQSIRGGGGHDLEITGQIRTLNGQPRTNLNHEPGIERWYEDQRLGQDKLSR